MTDKHLRESLRRLPEAGAGEGFTRAVLARLAEEPARAEDAAADPDHRWLGQRFRNFTLPAAAPRLAAAAAVMVVAATLALTLTPLLNHPEQPGRPGQPETVATVASAPTLESGVDLASAPAERRAQPVAGPTPGTEREPVAEASETAPRQAAVTVPDAVPTVAPAATPAASGAASAPTTHTAAPGEGRARALDPDERRRAVERLRRLRREQQQLRTRLAALTEAPAPTLVLGGDESLELVLDLSADAGAAGGAGFGARPASYHPEPQQRRYFH